MLPAPDSPGHTPVRTYAGIPAHERVEARRARLIAAGRRLIGRDGVAATTVRGAYEEAGLSQRYFYESFRTVEDLAVAVADEVAEEITEEAVAAVAEVTDPRARIATIFRALIDRIAQDPEAGRIMFIESAGNGAELAAWRRGMLLRAAAVLEAWMSDPPSTVGPPSDGRDRIAALMMAGGAVEAIVAWLDGDVVATPAELARSLARAVGEDPEG